MTWTDYPQDAEAFSVAYEQNGRDESLFFRCVAQDEAAARRCVQTVSIWMLASAGIEIPWADHKEEE